MEITSPDFENNSYIPARFTCDGDGFSPKLIIRNVPKEAKSLLLIVDDPDAPNGSFTHWLIWNIPPDVSKIVEGVVPVDAIEGLNDAGDSGYIAPCPPSDVHHYHFRLSALTSFIDLPPNSSREDLPPLDHLTLEKADLIGLYQKN